MTAPALVLLATDACTLCDKAFELLASMPELRGAGLDVVDVADNDQLLEEFGARLPVLAVKISTDGISQPLDWPFDAAAVLSWLRQIKQ
jgi:hypothetical protein